MSVNEGIKDDNDDDDEEDDDESLTDAEIRTIETLIASAVANGFDQIPGDSLETLRRLCLTIRALQRTQDDLVSEGYKMASSIGSLAAEITRLKAKDDPKLKSEHDLMLQRVKDHWAGK